MFPATCNNNGTIVFHSSPSFFSVGPEVVGHFRLKLRPLTLEDAITLASKFKEIIDRVCHREPKNRAWAFRQMAPHGTVTRHETQVCISNHNDKLNYQNKGKSESDFTAQKICIMFFQATQSLWRC